MAAALEIEPEARKFMVWGTHGTSLSRAESIRESGFVAKPGRIGVGAYFWTAVAETDECLDLARRLARAWATKVEKGGLYARDKDKSLAIVEVEISVEEDEVLPLDDPEMTFRLWSLLRRKLAEMFGFQKDEDWIGVNLSKCQEEIHGFIEAFILDLEENLETRFKVIFKSQGCPPLGDPLIPYLGNHSCFAIRDTDVISIMNITK
ncbi:hypothetical protein [Pseudomonas prosekii]|uniref:Uncharacterized protein n=1 Tax=Pseudomonas prosekii TaxID=1148509 RepID=A0A1H1V443_9PSED|nr:hypothetical protein [Pseudomonas prosekii]SDS78999.1 hypothetical protein SAMN05216222_2282 [Pseudomonas prosekii]